MRHLSRALLTVALVGTLLVAGCDLFASDSRKAETDYPTTLRPLSSERLNALKRQFEKLNDGNVCTPLNKYGFTELDYGPCIDSGRTYVDLEAVVGKKEVIEIAKAFLAKNARFTGVYDVSEARVRRAVIHDREGGTRHAFVDFRNQRYHGLEVKKTKIKVGLDGSGVYIVGGNWYPEIFIPEAADVAVNEARQGLIGETISYSDWSGPKTYTITEASFSEEVKAEKVVLPIEEKDAIELRVAWKIGIYPDADFDHPWWYVFVDTMTGERLKTRQMFVF